MNCTITDTIVTSGTVTATEALAGMFAVLAIEVSK